MMTGFSESQGGKERKKTYVRSGLERQKRRKRQSERRKESLLARTMRFSPARSLEPACLFNHRALVAREGGSWA